MSPNITIEDFNSICRFCLTKTGVLNSMYDGSTVPVMAKTILQLNMFSGDGYPEMACKRCIVKLSSLQTFYSIAHASDKVLRTLIEDQSIISPLGLISLDEMNSFDLKHSLEEELKLDLNSFNDDSTGSLFLNLTAGNTKQQDSYLETCSKGVLMGNNNECQPTFGGKNLDLLDYAFSDFSSETETNIKDQQPSLEQVTDQNLDPIKSTTKEIKCRLCLGVFNNVSLLKLHQKIHISERRRRNKDYYLCSLCGTKFKWKTSLSRHMRLHTGKTFVCHICSKEFTFASYLNSHMISHSNEKPFKCDNCEASFLQVSSLNKHKRKSHPALLSSELFNCGLCHKKYLTKDTLESHRSKYHPSNLFKCLKCDRCFKDQRVYRSHLAHHRRAKARKAKLKATIKKHTNPPSEKPIINQEQVEDITSKFTDNIYIDVTELINNCSHIIYDVIQ